MNITTKIIVTDTNIITDLHNANILEEFTGLDNVYISDLVKEEETNEKTGNLKVINKFKIIGASPEQLIEVRNLSLQEKKLSIYDLLNYVIARDNNCILATDDNRLKVFSEKNGVEVIRTLKIIMLMREHNIITTAKAIKACKTLKNCSRIPEELINELINKLEKGAVAKLKK